MIYIEQIIVNSVPLLLLYVPFLEGETEVSMSDYYKKLMIREITSDPLFRFEKLDSMEWKNANPELVKQIQDKKV